MRHADAGGQSRGNLRVLVVARRIVVHGDAARRRYVRLAQSEQDMSRILAAAERQDDRTVNGPASLDCAAEPTQEFVDRGVSIDFQRCLRTRSSVLDVKVTFAPKEAGRRRN